MSVTRPAQVFASITRTGINKTSTETKTLNPYIENLPEEVIHTNMVNSSNEITVCAVGELSLVPDLCKVMITLGNRKEQVQDVKNSVSRRTDYIMQTLTNHQIKDSDVTTSKVLSRVGSFYQLDTEITIQFLDIMKCQDLCNFLVEKLDESVHISLPEFIHSPQRLETLRRQVSLLAVSNARQKAIELGKFLHAGIGKPIAIHEESLSEWDGLETTTYVPETKMTVMQRRDIATKHVKVSVNATFQLISKQKPNEKKS